MHFLQCCDAAIRLLQCIWRPYLLFKRGGFLTLFKGMTTRLLAHITRFLRQWRRYNSSVRELSQLGDRELADMGISRSDIPRIAWDSSSRDWQVRIPDRKQT